MLSMVMYEVFEAVYFNKEDPLRNPILCVPFYDIPRDDVNKSFYLLMQCLYRIYVIQLRLNFYICFANEG